MRHGRARVSYPRGTHEAEATGEVDWWDRTRAENITITITITNPSSRECRRRRTAADQPARKQRQTPTGAERHLPYLALHDLAWRVAALRSSWAALVRWPCSRFPRRLRAGVAGRQERIFVSSRIFSSSLLWEVSAIRACLFDLLGHRGSPARTTKKGFMANACL